MKIIKLMADYYSFPLWNNSPGEVGNIDPESLPLSDELKERLNNWSEKYDSILNDEDPASSDFATKEDQLTFIHEGGELAKCLQVELGDAYQITYYSDY
ncbi:MULTISPECIES: hypothetical protein [unclassified Rahnella]|jgi:hypothetical protein|uniref:hypothetical protein n=1 Tax=Rahnella TaxID=34037 RepID=UPI000DC4F15A|nr:MULTISPECIES: hypothetical protein [unclassified Rahnella]QBJ11710.1 hypothetical protein EYS10_25615 [Rahnella aquatilis]